MYLVYHLLGVKGLAGTTPTIEPSSKRSRRSTYDKTPQVITSSNNIYLFNNTHNTFLLMNILAANTLSHNASVVP